MSKRITKIKRKQRRYNGDSDSNLVSDLDSETGLNDKEFYKKHGIHKNGSGRANLADWFMSLGSVPHLDTVAKFMPGIGEGMSSAIGLAQTFGKVMGQLSKQVGQTGNAEKVDAFLPAIKSLGGRKKKKKN
jgi:hypothetical protein